MYNNNNKFWNSKNSKNNKKAILQSLINFKFASPATLTLALTMLGYWKRGVLITLVFMGGVKVFAVKVIALPWSKSS